mgnify:CR=1 FL=1
MMSDESVVDGDGDRPPAAGTCVFVIAQDIGHFGYTVHLAKALHAAYGCNIEYWSHASAEKQCPEFATFHSLTDDQRMISFYCRHASRFSSDEENIAFFSASINALMQQEFGDTLDPTVNMAGEAPRVLALKRRLLRPDVLLCVNDLCHVFAWAGAHCETYGVPVLNLCPSQHQLQRTAAECWDAWQTIFGNLKPLSDRSELTAPVVVDEPERFVPVRADPTLVPRAPALYITYAPLVAHHAAILIPAGREVAGPVYMPAAEVVAQQQRQGWEESSLCSWLNEAPGVPVVYVSLGSMVRSLAGCGCAGFVDILLGALLSRPGCRVLTTINQEELSEMFPRRQSDSKIYFSSWAPQLAVLAHPAVRLFVTHGGANSVHESILYAVPMIVIPFFDDQRYNGPRLVELGLAVACLAKDGLTADQVVAAVTLALGDESTGSECADTTSCLQACLVAASTAAVAQDGLGRLVKEACDLCNFSIANPPYHD